MSAFRRVGLATSAATLARQLRSPFSSTVVLPNRGVVSTGGPGTSTSSDVGSRSRGSWGTMVHGAETASVCSTALRARRTPRCRSSGRPPRTRYRSHVRTATAGSVRPRRFVAGDGPSLAGPIRATTAVGTSSWRASTPEVRSVQKAPGRCDLARARNASCSFRRHALRPAFPHTVERRSTPARLPFWLVTSPRWAHRDTVAGRLPKASTLRRTVRRPQVSAEALATRGATCELSVVSDR